jgi:hypothetical protein
MGIICFSRNGLLLQSAHDENDLCSLSSVHISIIKDAVIPLLGGSGGQ